MGGGGGQEAYKTKKKWRFFFFFFFFLETVTFLWGGGGGKKISFVPYFNFQPNRTRNLDMLELQTASFYGKIHKHIA